jgi:hypothetical protein
VLLHNHSSSSGIRRDLVTAQDYYTERHK